MRAHELDGSGLIVNTIEVDSLDFMPGLVDASIGGSIGDHIIGGVLIPKPPEPLPPYPPETPEQSRAEYVAMMQSRVDALKKQDLIIEAFLLKETIL